MIEGRIECVQQASIAWEVREFFIDNLLVRIHLIVEMI